MIPLAFLTSGADMVIIAAIVLILFGGQKVPELMRGLGKGMGEFNKGLEEAKRTLYQASQETQNAVQTTSLTPGTPPSEHS